MGERGQVSLEAVIIMGVVVLVIISVFNIWWARMSYARDVGEAGEARMIGIMLAEGINNVYANGANFSLRLTEEEINFTALGNTQKMTGGGMVLPIVIDTSLRKINITKNMTKTGLGNWTTTVSILPSNITRLNPTAQYPQLTIRNNGTTVILYANSSNIQVS